MKRQLCQTIVHVSRFTARTQDSNLLIRTIRGFSYGPYWIYFLLHALTGFRRDDHDIADNTWKVAESFRSYEFGLTNVTQAGSSDSNDTAAGCVYDSSGTCFSDRKLNAIRAYHEWLPIRQVNVSDNLRIWRNFQIGELLDLTMLDTSKFYLLSVWYDAHVLQDTMIGISPTCTTTPVKSLEVYKACPF